MKTGICSARAYHGHLNRPQTAKEESVISHLNPAQLAFSPGTVSVSGRVLEHLGKLRAARAVRAGPAVASPHLSRVVSGLHLVNLSFVDLRSAGVSHAG